MPSRPPWLGWNWRPPDQSLEVTKPARKGQGKSVPVRESESAGGRMQTDDASRSFGIDHHLLKR